MKEKLLYLCHRIPYPANKGDKITTCHILTFLRQYYDVYLGCFIDDPFDFRYQNEVEHLCREAFFVTLSPFKAKLRGLSAFLSGNPITLPYYYHPAMQAWVDRTLTQQGIKTVFVYSGCMAQYVLGNDKPSLHKVMHFADIDSDKWRQYADKKHGVMRQIYRRECRTLERYENDVARQFDVSCFISDSETALFRERLESELRPKIQTLSNGIDCDFFTPDTHHHATETYPLEGDNFVVFTGAMNYWANVDAVRWFVSAIWPKVHRALPDSKFYIVGTSPSKEVMALNSEPGVIVTGRVDDVRPYLCFAKAAVAPMQIARGIQNKILEAMAMETTVITTQLGIEGIDNYPGDDVFVSDSPATLTQWVIDQLTQPAHTAIGSRQWLQANYSWNARLAPLLQYLRPDYA